MPMPRVKESCVLAVLQKATHTGTMGEWAIDWLGEFCKNQPALASQMCSWIENCDAVNEWVVFKGLRWAFLS